MSVAVFQQPLRLLNAPSQEIAEQRTLLTSVIFTLSFNYFDDITAMKVLKIIYRDQAAIYKLVLSSRFNQTVRDCWLQLQPQGWVILLGHELDQYLVNAITTAIGSGNY